MWQGVSAEFVLITAVSLFTIVNPLGATPLFLAHSASLPSMDVKRTARKASLTCCLVLLVFAVTGQTIFRLIGVTIPAFRIAGGILVFINALDMLKGANVRSRTLPEEQREAEYKEDISIMPLGIPLLSGPGAITTVIVLMTRSKTYIQDAIVLVSILLVSLATYVILSHSSILLKTIGPSGVRILNRLMGLFLAAVSIQFVINGLKDLVPEFAKLL